MDRCRRATIIGIAGSLLLVASACTPVATHRARDRDSGPRDDAASGESKGDGGNAGGGHGASGALGGEGGNEGDGAGGRGSGGAVGGRGDVGMPPSNAGGGPGGVGGSDPAGGVGGVAVDGGSGGARGTAGTGGTAGAGAGGAAGTPEPVEAGCTEPGKVQVVFDDTRRPIEPKAANGEYPTLIQDRCWAARAPAGSITATFTLESDSDEGDVIECWLRAGSVGDYLQVPIPSHGRYVGYLQIASGAGGAGGDNDAKLLCRSVFTEARPSFIRNIKLITEGIDARKLQELP